MTRDELLSMKAQPSSVPCGTCRACCKQDVIHLGDDEAHKFAWHVEAGGKVLDRKPDGECVYLTAAGCGVHDDAPDICRRFDCRILFLLTPKTQRRIRIVQNPSMANVYKAGKSRLHTLTIKG